MSQAACATLCRDVEAMHAFLKAQSRITDVATAMHSQSECLASRISEFDGLDFAGATALIEVISAGPWSEDQKKMLSNAVQLRLQDVMLGKSSKTRRKNQTCSSFERYLSESDMLCLSSSDLSKTLFDLKAMVDNIFIC
jgi:hypothetical protein